MGIQLVFLRSRVINSFKLHVGFRAQLSRIVSVVFAVLLASNVSWAATSIPDLLKSTNSLPTLTAKSWVIYEPQTGWVLAQKNADLRIEPASLTKLMTIYIAFDLLEKGELRLDDKVVISKKAWQMQGSRMFAEVGDSISLISILKGIIVQSGNDASVALAEHIAGTESAFIAIMNNEAEKMGLKNTVFKNPTGMPAEDHYSSAIDIAILSAAIINQFPDYYAWFAVKEFEFNNIVQKNRNNLLWRDSKVDGLKTGYTEAAGYCLASTSVENGMRVITVVTGTDSNQTRVDESMALLQYAHSNYQVNEVLSVDRKLGDIKVYGGVSEVVEVTPLRSYTAVIPKNTTAQMDYNISVPKRVAAPLEQSQTIGIANVSYAGQAVADVPIVFSDTVEEAGFVKRGVDMIKMKVDGFWEDD